MAPEKKSAIVVGAAAAGLAAAAAGVYLYRSFKKPQVFFEHGIRVAIIGTGWGVNVQVPQFRLAGINIFALCSRDQKRASEIAAQNQITHAFSSYDSLLSVDKVDLVSIVTPVYLHAPQTIAAIKAGKNVLCDKPLCLNADEAEDMLAAHREHPDKLCLVDHELRFTPAFLKAREHVRAGTIGAVLHVTTRVLFPMNSTKYTWWADASLGGGALGAIGSHVIDSYRFLLDGEVEEVSAHLQTLVKNLTDETGALREKSSDDYVSMQMRLVPRISARGSPAWSGEDRAIPAHTLIASRGHAQVEGQFVLSGSQGGIVISINNGSLTVTDKAGKVIDSTPAGAGNPFATTGTRALGVALQRALGPEKDLAALEPAATLEDGVAVQYAMDAARASHANDGKWIRAWNDNLETEDC